MDQYVRDANGALINTDDQYYKAILAARKSEKQAKMMAEKFDSLKSELDQIKEALKKIVPNKG